MVALDNGSTLLLADDDVRAVFDWAEAVAALSAAYGAPVTDAQFPPRTMARVNGAWLRTLTGIMPERDVMGAKLIAASTAHKVASYLIPLFDQSTMRLIALLDGNAITGFRTAATSALAVRRLCLHERPRVAVVGSGFEARTHVEALARSGPLAEVFVYSPRESSRAAFCEAMAHIGVAVRQAASSEEAVTSGDLVICAARSHDETPTIQGKWLRPGMTVVSIGSTLPEQRELDPESIARADLIVADLVAEVAHDTGDMIEARKSGVSFEHKLVSLSDIVSGGHPGRTSDEQLILYKSVGAALQDLAVAAMCIARARDAGIGTTIAAPIRPVAKGK